MKKIFFILIVLLSVGTISAREKHDSGIYYYDSWDEFYKYWNQAASNYSYVAIGYFPWQSQNEFTKLISGTRTSGFSQHNGWVALCFTYY
ncbi:MAG: hypothetical protein J5597_00435, partial [Spirochaetaceae bacterium]|nr:hypothetical protein [Spirochaetaceae bacterium]